MIGWKKNRPVRLSQIIIHSIYILLSLLIITTTLFFYGFLNDKIIFTIIFISLVLFGFVGSRNALLISLSFLAATLLISLGFRNDADYQGEEYLLIGASLLAGIDDTQEDILPSQLKRFQINTYALGHSGGIREYVQ